MSLYIIEARKNGEVDSPLNPEGRQPPFTVASYNQMFDYYCEHKGPGDFTEDAMRSWYKAQGWSIRRRAW